MVAQLCDHTKNPLTYKHYMRNFMVFELYLNKDVF